MSDVVVTAVSLTFADKNIYKNSVNIGVGEQKGMKGARN